MKKILFTTFTVLACLSSFAQVLSVDEFNTAIEKGNLQLVDVRTSEEFNNGYLGEALNIDFLNHERFVELSKFLDKNKPVYVYCQGGKRSTSAAEYLRKEGFSVFELLGGVNSWLASNKKLNGNTVCCSMTQEDYLKEVNSDKLVLVNFGAKWCPPCRTMIPVLEKISNQYKDIKVIQLDFAKNSDLAKQMKINSTPFFIFYKNGKEIIRKEGVMSEKEIFSVFSN